MKETYAKSIQEYTMIYLDAGDTLANDSRSTNDFEAILAIACRWPRWSSYSWTFYRGISSILLCEKTR